MRSCVMTAAIVAMAVVLVCISMLVVFRDGGNPHGSTYSAVPGKDAIATLDGERLSFPYKLEFNGKQWTRSETKPFVLNPSDGVQFRYECDSCDQHLLYFQGTSLYDTYWSIVIRATVDGKNGLYEDKVIVRANRKWDILYASLNKGRFEGPIRHFYLDGTVKFTSFTEQGELNGRANAFRPDGTHWWSGIYSNNELDLETVQVFDHDGKREAGLTEERVSQITSKLWEGSTQTSVLSGEQFVYRVKVEHFGPE